MNNMTKQVVRHFSHKHSRFLPHMIIEDKLKPPSNGPESANISSNISQSLEMTSNNCFSTNQVLAIIAVTCFLNFAFIVLIMICVQILGTTSKEQESLEEDVLTMDQPDNVLVESGQLTNWESSKLRLASLPDNIITKKVAERLFRIKNLKSKCRCTFHQHDSYYPISQTYHFGSKHSCNSDDSENELTSSNYDKDFQYSWNEHDECKSCYAVLDSGCKKN